MYVYIDSYTTTIRNRRRKISQNYHQRTLPLIVYRTCNIRILPINLDVLESDTRLPIRNRCDEILLSVYRYCVPTHIIYDYIFCAHLYNYSRRNSIITPTRCGI